MTEIEQVGPWIERLGLATVLLIVGIVLSWRVLSWLAKRVDKWFDRHLSLMDTLQQSLGSLVNQGSEGHTKTHSKLDAVHKDVQHIKEHIKPRGQINL